MKQTNCVKLDQQSKAVLSQGFSSWFTAVNKTNDGRRYCLQKFDILNNKLILMDHMRLVKRNKKKKTS